MTRVAILIVSHNTRDMTLACIESVLAETIQPHEVVVVENASSDGSEEFVSNRFGERVRLIELDENIGFGRGNNRAAAEASLEAEYLLLLNPDTVVREGSIDKLVAFAESRPEAGIWGGRTVFEDGNLNPASCWRRQTLWSLVCMATGLASVFRRSGLFNPEAYGGWRRDTVREVDIVSGCFMLIRRELWERLGGFDPEFFMYGEDADLCMRARKLGSRPMITPEATIVHHGGASDVVRADKLVRVLKAKMLLIRKHWTPASAAVGVRLLAMGPLTRAVAEWVLRRSHGSPWREVWSRRREWYGARPSEKRSQPAFAASRSG